MKTTTVNGESAWYFEVPGREIVDLIKAKATAREIGLHVLASAEGCDDFDGGDDATNNLPLAVFERCYDWRLGMAAVEIVAAIARAHRKFPRTVRLAVTRRSDRVYAIIHAADGAVHAVPVE
jgi:hypothetical protein